MIKRVLILLSALSAVATIGSANPLCTTNTIDYYAQNYTNLGNGCMVGDKLFFNFSYSPTSSGATPPDGTQVSVVGDSSDPNEPGLIFSSSFWSVSATNPTRNVYIDSSFSFTVTTSNLAPLIQDGTLSFANTFSTTGQGDAFIGETLVLAGGGSATLGVDSTGGPFTSVTSFAPVPFVTVTKDLQVTVRKGQTGSATITSFREGFSEIPEPVSSVLIGSGLLGFAFWRRRS
jgi:hypothetical protein